MLEISEIKSMKELRSVNFADLFYEIYQNPDGGGIARGIIASIDPSFVPGLGNQREEAIMLLNVRDSVAHERDEVLRRAKIEEERKAEEERRQQELEMQVELLNRLGGMGSKYAREFRQILELENLSNMLSNRSASMKSLYDPLMSRIQSLGFDELLDLLTEEIMDGSNAYAASLATDNNMCSEFIAALDERIVSKGNGGSNKALKGLYLLPKLKNDQELIIFFGNNFHTTFANIDAYSGLLYASEFFDFEGSYLRESILTVPKKEKEEILAKRRSEKKFLYAMKEFNDGDYLSALESFSALGDFKDALEMAEKCKEEIAEAKRASSYKQAEEYLSAGEFDKAQVAFGKLGEYKDSPAKQREAKRAHEEAKKQLTYDEAAKKLGDRKYIEAEELFSSLGEWKDASEKAAEARLKKNKWRYSKATELRKKGDFSQAIKIFGELGEFEDSRLQLEQTLFEQEEDRVWKEREEELRLEKLYSEGCEKLDAEQYDEAAKCFEELGGYKDSADMLARTLAAKTTYAEYCTALEKMEKRDFLAAEKAFRELGAYKDSQMLADRAQTAYEEDREKRYGRACESLDSKEYQAAISLFADLKSYKDSPQMLEKARDESMKFKAYFAAAKAFQIGDLRKAKSLLVGIDDYPAADALIVQIGELEQVIRDRDAAKEKLATAQSELKGKRAELKRRAKYVDEQRAPSALDLDQTNLEIEKLELSLKSLGMFSFKEKRAIQERIGKERTRAAALESRIPSEEAEIKKKWERTKESLDSEISDLERRVSSQKSIVARLEGKVSHLNVPQE